jgi:hypothetical protein
MTRSRTSTTLSGLRVIASEEFLIGALPAATT